uniref:Uncharacterized protein n=1 Tax=Arundo donax TaxID=35708 RepID=A0A0A9CF22_ARUDO
MTKAASTLALAAHHIVPSSITGLITVLIKGLAWLKMQSFWCFHSSQAARMIRLLRPFLHCLSTPLIALHHQLEKEVAVWRQILESKLL